MTGPGPPRRQPPRRRLSLRRRPRRRLSLRRRLALIAALAVAAGIALASVAAYLSSRATLVGQLDNSLQSQAHVVTSGPPINLDYPQNQLFALVPALQFVAPDGTFQDPPFQQVALPVAPADLAVARTQQGQVLRTVTVGGERLRMITVPYAGRYALQLTRPLADVDASLHRLAIVLLLVTAVGAGVAVTAGLAVARAGLAPVEELTAAAERIARTEVLGPPIPIRGGDEIARLAASFNAMLAALAAAQERQRRLVADAGHELRTPLTSLRTNIELLARSDARDRPLPPDDRARLLADLTGQVEELAVLVTEVTALARDEPPAADPEELDLAEIVAAAVTRVRRRAGSARVVSELEPTPLTGHRSVLERAVLNLLDNAVKWSPEGGEVYVGLRNHQLVVADQGPGIPSDELPHVFERFYRSPSARGLPGSGLGLAIVADAAREHGGVATLEPGPTGGTLARLVLPRPPAPPPAPAPAPTPAGPAGTP
ncbi:MAG: HAMP domain-containing sensor histidine kinase [Mycobacteriales bacterium]